jgi:hypothetical protein
MLVDGFGDKVFMSYFLWTLGSIVAYIGGLMIILRVTPRLLQRKFDEGLFMGMAALDVLGAILVFSAVVITLAVFSGAIAVRALDFLLLLGVLIIAGRTALSSFRPRIETGTFLSSRVIAGMYCLALAIAAFSYIVLLFRN